MGDAGREIGFAGLLGQDKAKKFIQRTLAAGRLPHALLFKGPEGVGKQLFARGMAAALNCRNHDQSGACGNCLSCRKFRSGNHPDFLVISPEKGAIKIEQVRRMTQTISYPPYESDTRIVLLEDVHTMRAEAANSLLKTLEEPPDDNLLVLTADSSREVLPTIASRCQVVPFHYLSQEDTVRILSGQPDQPDLQTAHLLARLSEGSPGRAGVLLKTGMVATLKRVITVVTEPDIASEKELGSLLRAAELMAEQKEHLPSFLGLLRIWLRDELMLACGMPMRYESEEVLPVCEGARRKKRSVRQLFAGLQAINKAERELARNCNRTLVCEVLLFAL